MKHHAPISQEVKKLILFSVYKLDGEPCFKPNNVQFGSNLVLFRWVNRWYVGFHQNREQYRGFAATWHVVLHRARLEANWAAKRTSEPSLACV